MDVVWFWLILIGVAALFFLVLRYLTRRSAGKRNNVDFGTADGAGFAGDGASTRSISDRSHGWWSLLGSSDSGDGGGGDGGGGD